MILSSPFRSPGWNIGFARFRFGEKNWEHSLNSLAGPGENSQGPGSYSSSAVFASFHPPLKGTILPVVDLRALRVRNSVVSRSLEMRRDRAAWCYGNIFEFAIGRIVSSSRIATCLLVCFILDKSVNPG